MTTIDEKVSHSEYEVIDAQVVGIQVPEVQRKLNRDQPVPDKARLLRVQSRKLSFYSTQAELNGDQKVQVGSKLYYVIPVGAKTVNVFSAANDYTAQYDEPVFR